jgi:uroporphyrinogen-III synthase
VNTLHGAYILVTRPAHQAENLCRLIEDYGGIAIRFPTLEIEAAYDCNQIQKLLSKPEAFQWVIFMSANAVNFVLKAIGGTIELIKRAKIAAIGKATAQALSNAGLTPDLVPAEGFTSEALWAELKPLLHVGRRVLIIRGQNGRTELEDVLQAHGVKVDYAEVYRRALPLIDPAPIAALLAANRLQCITITSGEAVENLVRLIPVEVVPALLAVPLVTISARIKAIAAQLGFSRITITEPGDSALIAAILLLLHGE